MNKQKDNWIDEVMASTDFKKDVPLSEVLRQRLSKIPREVQVMSVVIPMRSVYLAAAGFALLFTLNLLAVNYSAKTASKESTMYSNYFSYLDQI